MKGLLGKRWTGKPLDYKFHFDVTLIISYMCINGHDKRHKLTVLSFVSYLYVYDIVSFDDNFNFRFKVKPSLNSEPIILVLIVTSLENKSQTTILLGFHYAPFLF